MLISIFIKQYKKLKTYKWNTPDIANCCVRNVVNN